MGRHTVDADLARGLASGLHQSLRIAGTHFIDVQRRSSAQPYNDLVARLCWDSHNARVIRRRLLAFLDSDGEAQQVGDRIGARPRRWVEK